jgi:hypothetical protein
MVSSDPGSGKSGISSVNVVPVDQLELPKWKTTFEMTTFVGTV